jgi:hypothetical protein
VVSSYLPTTTIIGGCIGVDYSQIWFFLSWWFLLFSQEWWDHIRYVMYGSPTVCYWWELVITRFMGHNQ